MCFVLGKFKLIMHFLPVEMIILYTMSGQQIILTCGGQEDVRKLSFPSPDLSPSIS
jgi:hypothetical protein